MAGTIDKGTIASINAAKQTASVMTPTGIVTTGLVIPWHLRTSTGQLKKVINDLLRIPDIIEVTRQN